MKNIKKISILTLCAILTVTLFGCKKKNTGSVDLYGQVGKNNNYALSYATRSYTDGITAVEVVPGTKATINSDVYAGVTGKDYTDTAVYTLNDYITSMSTLNWNIHTWETSDDSAILDYLSYALYGFELNPTKTGYSIVPEMASKMPVDVTSEYVNLADANGKATDASFGVSWSWEKVEEADYTAETVASRKKTLTGADGFAEYYGGTLAQVAATYQKTETEFLTSLGLEDVADFEVFFVRKDEENKAFRIYLNPLCCWDKDYDSTVANNSWGVDPITAADYVYSMKMLLDPTMANRRADSFYAGSFVLYNAKNYFYQGQKGVGAATDFLGVDYDGYVAATHDDKLIFVWDDADTTSSSIQKLLAQYATEYASGDYGTTLYAFLNSLGGNFKFSEADVKAMNGKTITEIKANTAQKAILDELLVFDGEEEGGVIDFCKCEYEYAALDFSKVGIVSGSDAEGEYIDLIVATPIETPEYYVPYNLSSNWLVNKALYEAKNTYDSTKKTWSIKYGTNADNKATENTASFGPYVLSYYEDGKKYEFSRNENWWGYKDNKHKGQYQTDKVVVSVIGTHAAALSSFLSGGVDSIGLQADDMTTYGTSSQLRYNPESYTTKLSFNTDYDKLLSHGTNAQLLCLESFRKAFALAIDNKTFSSSYTSAGQAGFGLLNYLYVYDPINGLSYRNTDVAMKAIVDLYGLEYGAGKTYATLEDAYAAINGYDMSEAKALMKQAYTEAVAAGLWNSNCKKATFEMCVYDGDDIYVQMFNYFNAALKEACVGSGFEGKVSMTMKVDPDYYETMYAGNTDIIFTTWGGAASSPFTLLYECYCDSSTGDKNQMEYGFDTSKVTVAIKIDGVTYAESLQTWAKWCDGVKDVTIKTKVDDVEHKLEAWNSYDYATRCAIFANLENAYLGCYATKPIYYRNSALLVSKKGDYAVQEYLDTIGFGGIQFYTFNYTDAQWAAIETLDYTE